MDLKGKVCCFKECKDRNEPAVAYIPAEEPDFHWGGMAYLCQKHLEEVTERRKQYLANLYPENPKPKK